MWQSRPFEVACEFRGWAADYVAEREWSNDQSVVPGADGGVELRFTARGLEEVSRWVLGFGENARVLEPPALVQHVARSLREAAARYQGEARG